METTHQEMLAREIASPEAMLSVDSLERRKSGKESVGVARQYCGEMELPVGCLLGICE